MNIIRNKLHVGPNLEIDVTHQSIPVEKIIGWEDYVETNSRPLLLYPTPILVDLGGFFELLQPHSTWAADIGEPNFSHLYAIVINAANNIKAINLLRHIHTNRTNKSRKDIVKNFLNNTVLKQHIIETYSISEPINHINDLFGHEVYCSRQLSRLVSAKKNKANIIKQSTAIDNKNTVKNDNNDIEKGQHQKEDPPLKTKAQVKKYRKLWNQFSSSKKGIKQFDQIISKFPTEKQSKAKLRVMNLMDEHATNLDQAWVKINQGLKELDGEKS